MTGYGSARAQTEGGSVSVEIRSVNSRHLNLEIRVPAGAEDWEPPLRELLSDEIERGRVRTAVRAEEESGDAPPLELDRGRVESYLTAFRNLREEYALPGQVDLALLAGCGDLLQERETRVTEWASRETVATAAREALGELVEMREREGAELEADLRERLSAIREELDRAEELAPRRLDAERERLREAVAELVPRLGEEDEQRIGREIAMLADKWDIGEEITRARAHLEGFDDYLSRPAGEPVGKRLKFLAQELHREINTLGAKGNDAEISRAVVEMKNELESMREQIENVE